MNKAAQTSTTLLAALEAAGDIAYFWDIESDRLDLLGDLESIFGPNGADGVNDGETFHARLNAEDLTRRLRTLSEHLTTGRRFDCEYRVRRSDGVFCWVHDRGRIEIGPNGAPKRMTGTLRIVTDRKAAEEGQRDRAVYDGLTGHYNQTRLRESLEHSLLYAKRYNSEGGYMVVGIDDMAGVTEGHGEDAANRVIVAVGRRLEKSLRTADLIGRVEGGRFGVVLSHCGEDGLVAAANKVIAAMAATPVPVADGSIVLSVSVGGVTFPGVAKTPTGAMANSDSALLSAMRSGAGQFVLYETPASQTLRDREQFDAGASLLDALRDDRIALAYQPVVRGADLKVAYHETLLRILDRDRGALLASDYVSAAENLGHSGRIDRHVLELAVGNLEDRPDAILAVNISGLTATDRSWLRLLGSLVKGRPEIAKRLIVEITETAEMYDFEDSARFVAAVRELGCRVALDDFGVGHTSFRHLKSFAIDIVKIDGSYIRGIADNAEHQKFVDTLLGFAEPFGFETVAECVETEADRDYLLDRGVTYLQGFMFGRPELDGLATMPRANTKGP